MSVNYKLFQDVRQESATRGKWYGRAVHTNAVTLSDLSRQIQENVSVKESDVYGVLIELVNVMKTELLNSHIVKLDRLGTFKVGMRTLPAAEAEEFTPLKNIAGYRVNFIPEVKMATVGGKRHRTYPILDGISVKKVTEKKEEPESSGGGSGGA